MNDEFSSEREYFANKRDDGRPVEFPSRKFYGGPTKLFTRDVPAEPPVADEVLTPEQVDAERVHYQIDLNLMHTLDDCERYLKMMMRDGFKAMEEGRDSPARKGRGSGVNEGDQQPEAPTPQPCAADASASDGNDTCPIPGRGRPGSGAKPVPEPAEPPEPRGVSSVRSAPQTRKVPGTTVVMPASSNDDTPKGQKTIIEAQALMEVDKATRAAEGEREASASGDDGDSPQKRGQSPNLSRGQRINLGFMAVKLLPKIAEQRAEVAHAITERAGKLNIRDRFMQDRAVAVVYGLLLYLDKEWEKLGFGAWMPFRWPDQWLNFCGLLTRILAANGLIHAKHPETYRKLLDETPPVTYEGTVYDRAKEAKTPHNMSRCKANQGAYTMSELKKRYDEEITEPKRQMERYIDESNRPFGHMVEPPPE